jgi:hypothetical protein
MKTGSAGPSASQLGGHVIAELAATQRTLTDVLAGAIEGCRGAVRLFGPAFGLTGFPGER